MKISVGDVFKATLAFVTVVSIVATSVHQICVNVDTIRGVFAKTE